MVRSVDWAPELYAWLPRAGVAATGCWMAGWVWLSHDWFGLW